MRSAGYWLRVSHAFVAAVVGAIFGGVEAAVRHAKNTDITTTSGAIGGAVAGASLMLACESVRRVQSDLAELTHVCLRAAGSPGAIFRSALLGAIGMGVWGATRGFADWDLKYSARQHFLQHYVGRDVQSADAGHSGSGH
jgi:hypothetical protein